MNNPTPDVSSHYGAPTGRPDRAQDTGLRIHLQRIPLDNGGYDRGGAYWGLGAPLYAYDDEEGDWSYLRARSRDDAKRQIRDKWPDARFYR